MSLLSQLLAEAAEIDYRRAKRACERMKAEVEVCRMYADYGEECMYCPLEWVATIEEVLTDSSKE